MELMATTAAATTTASTTTHQNGAATSSSSSEAQTPSQPKMDPATSSLMEAQGNESRALFTSASNRTTSALIPPQLLLLLRSGKVATNIEAAKQALNEPNDIMIMPDDQRVPVYWGPDNNTLKMLRDLNTKGADHAVTKHLALGVLRLIFDGFQLKNTEDVPLISNKKAKRNVKKLVRQLTKSSNGAQLRIQFPWLTCLRPVVSIQEQLNEKLQNAMHYDLTNESVQQSALRTALRVHPLLIEAFRSFGYQVHDNVVLGWSEQSLHSSDNNTHCLDFKISGGGGGSGSASLPYASIHTTLKERCSTRDVEMLQERSEELVQPFLRLSLFYETHGLILVDVHNFQSDFSCQVSLINFVCVLLKTSSNLFWTICLS
jgi:hypothetical protein